MKEYLVIERLGNRVHEIVLLRTSELYIAERVFQLLSMINVHGYEEELNKSDLKRIEEIEGRISDLTDDVVNWRDESMHDTDSPFVPEIMNVRVVKTETCKSSD